MPQEKDHYRQLLERYLDNTCTPQEAKELFDYLQQDASNRLLLEEIRASFIPPADAMDAGSAPWSGRVKQQLLEKIRPPKVVPLYKKRWPRVAAAVLLLAVASLGGWRYYRHVKQAPTAYAQSELSLQDLPPGGNKAVLTLANGATVLLDSTGNGAISSQGATKIIQANGLLTYQAGNSHTATVLYNTVATPRGGQYKIVLPDGTRVWLNAASSLRFPTAFNGQERSVTLHGEGYFEVAHRQLPQGGKMPFKVQLADGAVEVLGTHFNIMAYPDEAEVRTTLLQGAVNVQHDTYTTRLAPGQQATWKTAARSSIRVTHTDTEEAIAWKQGYFRFNRAGVADVMRQLQRWYNIEVRYEGESSQREFWGRIPRNIRLGEALRILELSNIHCSMAGDTIIVHQ
ncbi:FecR family protein [Chitinophaga japonensis]|uniref:FecR family protein n=1 Tax=Chitinophaga japonensis TaxID=104662 RepID=A0A562T3Y3_CHIJA|nr:FecR family protein [Chitinophaga japonensis]TWI88247.1 FecR family protein [Chitinophaga japonensis]